MLARTEINHSEFNLRMNELNLFYIFIIESNKKFLFV